jgi:hypothetical protein
MKLLPFNSLLTKQSNIVFVFPFIDLSFKRTAKVTVGADVFEVTSDMVSFKQAQKKVTGMFVSVEHS